MHDYMLTQCNTCYNAWMSTNTSFLVMSTSEHLSIRTRSVARTYRDYQKDSTCMHVRLYMPQANLSPLEGASIVLFPISNAAVGTGNISISLYHPIISPAKAYIYRLPR
jgi:hypothetical protein